MTNPIYDYGRDAAAAARSPAARSCPNGLWPAAYDGRYLFGDYVCGKIRSLRSTGARLGGRRLRRRAGRGDRPGLRPVGLGQALYYLTWTSAERERCAGSPTPAIARPARSSPPAPTSGGTPLGVFFDGDASTDPDGDALTYSWDFGDGSAHADGRQPGARLPDGGHLPGRRCGSPTAAARPRPTRAHRRRQHRRRADDPVARSPSTALRGRRPDRAARGRRPTREDGDAERRLAGVDRPAPPQHPHPSRSSGRSHGQRHRLRRARRPRTSTRRAELPGGPADGHRLEGPAARRSARTCARSRSSCIFDTAPSGRALDGRRHPRHRPAGFVSWEGYRSRSRPPRSQGQRQGVLLQLLVRRRRAPGTRSRPRPRRRATTATFNEAKCGGGVRRGHAAGRGRRGDRAAAPSLVDTAVRSQSIVVHRSEWPPARRDLFRGSPPSHTLPPRLRLRRRGRMRRCGRHRPRRPTSPTRRPRCARTGARAATRRSTGSSTARRPPTAARPRTATAAPAPTRAA